MLTAWIFQSEKFIRGAAAEIRSNTLEFLPWIFNQSFQRRLALKGSFYLGHASGMDEVDKGFQKTS